MQGHQPHPATPLSGADFLAKSGKKRGSYNCGRCGQPKKGHKCQVAPDDNDGSFTPISTAAAESSTVTTLGSASAVLSAAVAASTPSSAVRVQPPGMRRRALSFDDVCAVESVEDVRDDGVDLDLDMDWEFDLDLDGSGGLPACCLWEILRRLPPSALLSAAGVCHGWREVSKRIWRAAEELQIRVPAKSPIEYIGSVLQKSPGILKLSLSIESDIDATVLACIAFSCPDLQSLEITIADSSINRISGDELGRFIADKRCLTCLKIEGCSNLGGFTFSSTSLSTLWLSDLHSLSKMIFNCPNLEEISLDFSRKQNDTTDIVAVVDGLGRSCRKLQNIHIASSRLSHAAALALSASNLRALRMLSLVLGSEITDASVAAFASSFPELELLDLSGSSITDSGIGMICNVYPETLSKLLLALCPNITSSGIQFAAAQLPNLELMDCGMTICDLDSEDSINEDDRETSEIQRTPNKLHHMYQKLIIKHDRLKKLSLWGCSGLDALYLNCPRLHDLNLNACRNLHPERMLLQCPNLETIHASGCEYALIKTLEAQACEDFSAVESPIPSKHLPDGSKRVRVPYYCSPQPSDEKGLTRTAKRQRTTIVTS
ncbi:F-box/LRR-repeat protein 17 [Andrographis paniculata]|uniref:F-box/LRR-repeat protein 17 n=1 Tax=Andrographis paniculata TaxID=175694 RepID=UPI0021E97963|nr:F-box/LRR-repeat protein 17 [Andrographis paniculata]